MGTYELEHLRLLYHKLIEALILLLLIGIEVSCKFVHVLLMVKAHLLNIKEDSVKTLKEVLEGTDIVEWGS